MHIIVIFVFILCIFSTLLNRCQKFETVYLIKALLLDDVVVLHSGNNLYIRVFSFD